MEKQRTMSSKVTFENDTGGSNTNNTKNTSTAKDAISSEIEATQQVKRWYEQDEDEDEDDAFGEEMKKFSASFLFQEGDDAAAASDDVRRIAEALAPQISEFEDLLLSNKMFISDTSISAGGKNPKTTTTTTATTSPRGMKTNEVFADGGEVLYHSDHHHHDGDVGDEEDDNLDNELQKLAMSEQLLREELEFAHDFTTLITPGGSKEMEYYDPPEDEEEQEQKTPAVDYSLQDHANYLKMETEKVGGWYYCDMTHFLIRQSPTAFSKKDDTYHRGILRDYCLPLPFRRLKRLYGGLVHYNVHPTPPATVHEEQQMLSNPQDQQQQQCPEGTGSNHPTANSTTNGLDGSEKKSSSDKAKEEQALEDRTMSNDTSSTTSEQAESIPQSPAPKSSNSGSNNEVLDEPLPVRTVSIWIRPDVLCGAVMDAVYNAFESTASDAKYTTLVMKRQGGHLRGAVLASKRNKSSSQHSVTQVAYVADAQLCTMKNETLERRLLIRFYHIQDDPEALQELSAFAMMKQQQEQVDQEENEMEPMNLGGINLDNDSIESETENHAALTNRHLKQASSLIQRIVMAHDQVDAAKNWLGALNDTVFFNQQEMQHAVGRYLETNYKPCLSVRDENKKTGKGRRRLTLPSLSSDDWPLLQESWSFCHLIFDELDTRGCSYNTLATMKFGQFPCLPTLDLQYCSQLRRLSRETMITQLLKAAKELEDYAKSTEYECASFLTILDPMIRHYGIPTLRLPTPKKLEDYPLEYVPPQVTCPPWGSKVVEALNQVAAETTVAVSRALPPAAMGNSIDDAMSAAGIGKTMSQHIATNAVRRVFCAFMKQDDEEQAARLGRKNAQVMDRLANVVSHQRAVLYSIRDAHRTSKIAEQAADEFLSKAQQATNVGEPGYPRILQHQVPVLNIRIRVGGSLSGTCFITPNHMLLTTSTYIPFVGRGVARATLFDLSSVEFQADDSAQSSLLNPFPNTMTVLANGEVVYSFRPSLGAARLCKFIAIVKSLSEGDSEFSQPDRIVNHDDDDKGSGHGGSDVDAGSEDEPIVN